MDQLNILLYFVKHKICLFFLNQFCLVKPVELLDRNKSQVVGGFFLHEMTLPISVDLLTVLSIMLGLRGAKCHQALAVTKSLSVHRQIFSRVLSPVAESHPYHIPRCKCSVVGAV